MPWARPSSTAAAVCRSSSADEYLRLIGFYHNRIERLLADGDPTQAAAAKTLVGGAAWQRLSSMETALAQRAVPEPTASPSNPLRSR